MSETKFNQTLTANDGTLFENDNNSKDLKHMVKFEQEVLKLNRYKTLYWIAFIQQLKVGLIWRYYIFDLNHQLVRKARWIDDRWDYEWWHDWRRRWTHHNVRRFLPRLFAIGLNPQ